MEPVSGTFQSLPPDAQRLVIQTRPGLIPAWSRTSSSNKQLLSSYFTNACQNKPISITEVREFIDWIAVNDVTNEFAMISTKNYPYSKDKDVNQYQLVMDLYQLSEDPREKEPRFKIKILSRVTFYGTDLVEPQASNSNNYIMCLLERCSNRSQTPLNEVLHVSTLYQHNDFNGGHVVRFLRQELPKILSPGPQVTIAGLTFNTGVELDFTSQYLIYQRRLGCVKANPNYALQKILTALDLLTAKINSGIFIETFTAHARLIGEAKMVDIEISEFKPFIAHDENFTTSGIYSGDNSDEIYRYLIADGTRIITELRNYFISKYDDK